MAKRQVFKLWPQILVLILVFSLAIAKLSPVFAQLKSSDKSDQLLKLNNSSAKQDIDKMVQAVIDKDKASLDQITNSHLNSLTTSLYIKIAGLPSSALTSLSPEERKIAQEKLGGGLIGDMTQVIAYTFKQPASFHTYLADVMQNAHFIPQAQAQGLGFASLDPILNIWKLSRNFAYMFFVIIILVIGFMIMFRAKLGGQTVITAQQAIPSVIIALIVVTFSYAIAGILIDIMYLIMYLIVGLFNSNNSLISLNIIDLGKEMLFGNNSAYNTMNDVVTEFVEAAQVGVGGDFVNWIGGITLGLIISLGVLFGVFKLLFELIKSYANIILEVAFAPLLLMLAAIPGKNTFSSWIKFLIGNLASFPAVLLLLVVQRSLVDQDLSSGGFMPPYLLNQGAGAAITSLVSIAILLAMPEAIKEIKKAMGVSEGVFHQLAGVAFKQASSGEVAIPAALAAPAAMYGGARGGISYLQTGKRDPRELMKAIVTGHKVEKGKTVGGAAKNALNWWERGQNVRVMIDRLFEGRGFQAEDVQKQLTQIARGQRSHRNDSDEPPKKFTKR